MFKTLFFAINFLGTKIISDKIGYIQLLPVVWEIFTCFEYALVWITDTRGDQLNYFKL